MTMINYMCERCGKTFERAKHGSKRYRYCSQQCSGLQGMAAHWAYGPTDRANPSQRRQPCVRGHELSGDNIISRGRGGRRCRRCHYDMTAERDKRIGYQGSRRRRCNEASRRTATRAKKQWTGPELEIAARPELTARQVAEMIGRSVFAVQYVRRAVRVDPRKQALL